MLARQALYWVILCPGDLWVSWFYCGGGSDTHPGGGHFVLLELSLGLRFVMHSFQPKSSSPWCFFHVNMSGMHLKWAWIKRFLKILSALQYKIRNNKMNSLPFYFSEVSFEQFFSSGMFNIKHHSNNKASFHLILLSSQAWGRVWSLHSLLSLPEQALGC